LPDPKDLPSGCSICNGDFTAELEILDAFEVVVSSDGQNFLRVLLTDHVLIELLKDATRVT
jgi:hypothetical protein